jgi:uncharacterized protein involved in tolerance to divalent cations
MPPMKASSSVYSLFVLNNGIKTTQGINMLYKATSVLNQVDTELYADLHSYRVPAKKSLRNHLYASQIIKEFWNAENKE